MFYCSAICTNCKTVEIFFLFYGLYKPQNRKKISIVLQFVQTAEEKFWITYGLYKPQRLQILNVLLFV